MAMKIEEERERKEEMTHGKHKKGWQREREGKKRVLPNAVIFRRNQSCFCWLRKGIDFLDDDRISSLKAD